jgi:chromosome segregation ATPase
MEKIKSTMEERAAATEERLKLLREQVASQQVQDTDVSQQLENLEAAKTALQARATRAAEDANTLRQELTDSRAKCSTLAHANTKLEERVKEVLSRYFST